MDADRYDVALPAEAAQLLAQARRVLTACGDGAIAWHVWGSGPPTVLLHGGSGSWNHWLHNIAPLAAAGRMVCVPDLPGFGDSAPPPRGQDADAIVEPLATGLREILGHGACDLVGFSFGSIVAALLAAVHPPLVRRLVVLGSPVLPLRHDKGVVSLAPWRHLPSQELRNAAHRHNLKAMMLHRRESITATALALHAMNVPRDRMRRRRLSMTDATARALAQARCPVWAIYGAEDVLYRGEWEQVAGVLHALPYLRELLLVPGAGHWVQFEEPQLVNAALARMLAD